MKRAVIAILAAMVMGAGTLPAQTLEVRRVGLDSLVHFLRKEFNPEIYFIMDEKEQSSFSVSAPRDRFMEAAFDQMREKGYVISSYGNARFILNSKTVFTSLPAGYFDDGSRSRDNSEMERFLAEQNTVVTFANKTYEIGDPGAGRRGKVYLSGHVRDV